MRNRTLSEQFSAAGVGAGEGEWRRWAEQEKKSERRTFNIMVSRLMLKLLLPLLVFNSFFSSSLTLLSVCIAYMMPSDNAQKLFFSTALSTLKPWAYTHRFVAVVVDFFPVCCYTICISLICSSHFFFTFFVAQFFFPQLVPLLFRFTLCFVKTVILRWLCISKKIKNSFQTALFVSVLCTIPVGLHLNLSPTWIIVPHSAYGRQQKKEWEKYELNIDSGWNGKFNAIIFFSACLPWCVCVCLFGIHIREMTENDIIFFFRQTYRQKRIRLE